MSGARELVGRKLPQLREGERSGIEGAVGRGVNFFREKEDFLRVSIESDFAARSRGV